MVWSFSIYIEIIKKDNFADQLSSIKADKPGSIAHLLDY